MNIIDLEKWRGPRDAAILDPRAIEFKARSAPPMSCKGCVFDHQSSAVCTVAGREAKLRGLEACDAGVVYVLVEKDPRQLGIEG
jgi:hypothetical protein